MKIPDVQLFVQDMLYLTIIMTGFCVSIPVGLTTMNFDGNCILYADISWKNSSYFTYTLSPTINCNAAIYFNVFASVFFCLAMFCYYGYALCQTRKDTNIGSQMWVMPFVLISAAMSVVSFVISCILSVGFKTICDGLLKSPGILTSCSDSQNIDWNKSGQTDYTGAHFYHYLTVAQVASWICFLTWVAQCVLGIVRFIRNRRLRSQGYNGSLNSDKDKIGDVEPTA